MNLESATHTEQPSAGVPVGTSGGETPDSVESYPLSEGQLALWFMHRLAPGSAAYNVAYGVTIPTMLNMGLYRRALDRVAERHPMFRAAFPADPRTGRPTQQVRRELGIDLRIADASGWSEDELGRHLAEAIYGRFDLENGPLARLHMMQLAADKWIALPVFHHAITDLWSMALFVHDLAIYYESEVLGAKATLRPLRAQFWDYARRESEMLAGPGGEQLWSYWKQQLSGEIPILEMRTDRPRPPVQGFRGGARSLVIPTALKDRLESIAAAQGATLHTLAMAAFFVLLNRYSGQSDIILGAPKACRSFSHANTVGYFTNPVMMRADLTGNPRFGDFVEQIRQTSTAGFRHGEYPFSLLVQRLRPAVDFSRTPLHQVGFSWQKTTHLAGKGFAWFSLNKSGGKLGNKTFPVESLALQHRPAPLDISAHLAETEEGLGVTLEYSTALYDPDTAQRLLEHFANLLGSVAANPQARISDLDLLGEDGRRRVLVEWNDAAGRQSFSAPVQAQLERQARLRPDAPAIVCGAAKYTYAELNRSANRLAHRLRRQGVGPDTPVAICLGRSPRMIVALLAVLKAGGAYIPLDPNYPAQRLESVLTDSKPLVLLTETAFLDRFAALPSTICLDTEAGSADHESDKDLAGTAHADNLAYIIYTSGSTGAPKGVMLHHRGLANLVEAQTREFGITARDRVLQFASFSFDASVSEIFMALTTGAALHLAPVEILLSPRDLARVMREQGVTTITLPPSLLSLLPPEDTPQLSCLISAGEACTWEIAERWAPGRRMFNAYGPTEATIGPSSYRVREPLEGTRTAPIGRPISNTYFYIVGEAMSLAPPGAVGELYIGGAGLARGYMNQPGLTAEYFVPDPFGSVPGARIYRTGDRARYLPDGNVELVGRTDDQVKIRGFRIELGEIERILKADPRVRDAVVVARQSRRGDSYVAAYVAPTEPGLEVAELRAGLRAKLPEYMLPSSFVLLESLPLTANRKVDRKALPDPRLAEDTSPVAAPRNELERAIANIWREALDINRVGTHDNFFDLGGHSLLIPKIHAAIADKLGRELPMTDLFRYPTVSALAERLAESERQTNTIDTAGARARQQRQALERQRARMRRPAAPPVGDLHGY